MPQPALPRAETPSAAPSASSSDYVPATPAAGTTPAATSPEPTPADDGAPAAVPKAPAAKEIPSVLTQPVPMRKLREMPPDYRADFPALSIEVHVYERETARRMVMINGHRYHEGERLAEGPLVVEIVREGIVFEHRGEKVLYTLGR
jgi:general secretion pathway protein B